MRKTVLKPMLAFMLSAGLFSCNSGDTKKETEAKTDTAANTATIAQPASFTPFDVMEISHQVKDYGKWKPLYEGDSVNRRANGLEDIVVGRNLDNENEVQVVLAAADMAKAKAMANDPKLKEAMAKGGVISKPDVSFWHIVRYNPEPKEKQWVEISHKVKDYAAWLKVFDAEGSARRASEGMLDVAIGRSAEDSNMVKLVFDITDLVKAKAAIASEEKKKLMIDAGVVGMPKMIFYKKGE